MDNTILAVDDEAEIRMVIEETLKDTYNVHTVKSGYEALAEIKKSKPDLILLDINMPGLDGYETLQRIREIDRNIPVIILTVVDSLDTAVKIMKLGAIDYFNKPFNTDEIMFVIKNVLARCNNKIQPDEVEELISAINDTLIKKNLTLNEAIREFRDEYTRMLSKKSNGSIDREAQSPGNNNECKQMN